jgi:hypothetical protein
MQQRRTHGEGRKKGREGGRREEVRSGLDGNCIRGKQKSLDIHKNCGYQSLCFFYITKHVFCGKFTERWHRVHYVALVAETKLAPSVGCNERRPPRTSGGS